MPPKRKALTETDRNMDISAPASKKASTAKGKGKGKGKGKAKEKGLATGIELTENQDVAHEAAALETAPSKKPVPKTSTSKASKNSVPNTSSEAPVLEKPAHKDSASKESGAKKTASKGATSKKSGAESSDKSVPGSNATGQEKTTKAPRIKYSNSDTLSGGPPEYVNMAWIGGEEDESDSENGEPEADIPCKVGEKLTNEMIKQVSDLGYPISEDGLQKLLWLDQEQENRDPDAHNMYIYNDFAGYGTTEVFANLLKDFSKDLFKKDVSPYKKWAYVEGLAAYLQNGMIAPWMMSDDPDAIEETINMFGTMLLTSFEMLSEHKLLGPYPASPIPNIGIISILLIEFATHGASDCDVRWAHEVVRALDKAGIDPPVRKQVHVSQKEIDAMRDEYRDKEEDDSYDSGVNVYENYRKLKCWEPEDDNGTSGRQWARWDWRKEFAAYKEDHRGGDEYDITQMSKADRARYEFNLEGSFDD